MSKYLLFRKRTLNSCGIKITPVTIALSATYDKDEEEIYIDVKNSFTGDLLHQDDVFLNDCHVSISQFTAEGQRYILERVIETIHEDFPALAEELVTNGQTLLEFDISDYTNKWYKVGIDMMKADYMKKYLAQKEAE